MSRLTGDMTRTFTNKATFRKSPGSQARGRANSRAARQAPHAVLFVKVLVNAVSSAGSVASAPFMQKPHHAHSLFYNWFDKLRRFQIYSFPFVFSGTTFHSMQLLIPSQIKPHPEFYRRFGSRRACRQWLFPLPSAVTLSRGACGTPSGRAAGRSSAALNRLTIAVLCSRQCALQAEHPATRCTWLYL